MAYDLLIKGGLVIDGSGMPPYRADVGIGGGKIIDIGRLRGAAQRCVDAHGLVVSPGFIDNHCHYDAQVTWDPLCSDSCYHGATTVVIGNCSLGLAPLRPGTEDRVLGFLSYVEAIPMPVLKTVDMTWQSYSDYLAALDHKLGVNVGTLIGHSAVRYYVMGDDSQKRAATPAELQEMQAVVRDGMKAGALGLSISKSKGHYDPQGNNIPAFWADEAELFALGDVLAELGTGIIQCSEGRTAELHDKLMSRLSEATGRQVIYNSLMNAPRQPEQWKKVWAAADEAAKAGIRANPTSSSKSNAFQFTMRNSQEFRGVPSWHPILFAPDEEKLRAYQDPEIRRKLHAEVVEWIGHQPNAALARDWPEKIFIKKAVLPRNKLFEGKSISHVAQATGKGIIDAFLDLVVEEGLDTAFITQAANTDVEVTGKILNNPHAYIGLSDGGAHVQFQTGVAFSTRLLGYWVREQRIMSIEQAVRRLTFESAMVFGMYDRGLLRPGLAADIVIFDPETIAPLAEEKVHDFPAGAWRMRQLATGIHSTVVNGQILIEEGRPTGALPGRVLRNSYYTHNPSGLN